MAANYLDEVGYLGTDYDYRDKRANGLDAKVSGSGVVYGSFAKDAPLTVVATGDVVHTSGNLLPASLQNYELSNASAHNYLGYSIPAGKYRLTIKTASGVSTCRLYFRHGTSTNLSTVAPESNKDIVLTFSDTCTNVYASQGSGRTEQSILMVGDMALVRTGDTWDGTSGTPETLTVSGSAECRSFGGDHFLPASGTVTVTGATNAAKRLADLEQQLAELQAIVLESDN